MEFRRGEFQNLRRSSFFIKTGEDREQALGVRTIAQVRREIGKYVDKKEVARLERYVTLN